MFAGILFDWRGTLVHDPPLDWWVSTALTRLGRKTEEAEVSTLVTALEAASHVDAVIDAERELDCSASAHYEGTMLWFREAGLDDEFAQTLYGLDLEAESHPFFPDVGSTLRALHERGIAIALVSDIHFDLRPEFDVAGFGNLIDSYVLSFEHGLQKPDLQLFKVAIQALSLQPDELLMVGDRASHDGGAVAAGITTLLLPRLASASSPRDLDAVLGLIDRTA